MKGENDYEKEDFLFFDVGILCLLMLCSCTKFKQSGELREETEQMLNSLIADDFEAFYSQISDACSEEDAIALFPQMRDYLNGATTYELELYHMSARVDNGVHLREEKYFVKTDGGNFYVSIQTTSEVQGIAGFNIVKEEESGIASSSTGTIFSMSGASLVQWALLMFALLETVFVIFSVVDCARQRIAKKALWILLILFASGTFMLTLSSSGLNFRFNLGFLFSHTALIVYNNGTRVLRLFVPIGAIIYWCLRKKLLSKNKTEELSIPVFSPEDYNAAEEDSQNIPKNE